ncbi:MAG TPA: hypothetical protein VLC94_03650 [Candidatus Acidoferrum sp.]|nr:hypothetical protein [Candidatus Acidoferrum sp.]
MTASRPFALPVFRAPRSAPGAAHPCVQAIFVRMQLKPSNNAGSTKSP